MDRVSRLPTRAAACFTLLLPVSPALAAEPASAGSGPRHNVLLLVSDDLCSRLSCYGDPLVRSPNIDRLAARGVRFERAYCQFPLCNPSRASLLTGLRPDTVRVYGNRVHFRQNVPEAQSVGQTFQKAGYHVMRVGKLYHYGVPTQIGTDGLDDPPTWNERFNPAGCDVKQDRPKVVRTVFDKERGRTVLEDDNELGETGAVLSWLASEHGDAEHTDGMIAEKAVQLLEANRDRRFFLAVGFFRPHTPYVAPRDPYFGYYPPEKMPLWREPEGWFDTVPRIALNLKPEQQHMTDEQRQQCIQAYYASTTFMDAQVGRVLDALERLKLADNTVVVFISDHGYQLGEHRQWQKLTLFESSARVPMIIAAPGGARSGVAPEPVELVDLHATLAELCNVPAPKTDGRSLMPLMSRPDADWDGVAITQVNRAGQGRGIMGYSVRTARHRYTEWDGGNAGAELYDYESDPHELRNLANDPAHAGLIAKMKGILMERAGKPMAPAR